jgi:hypothetical protein
MKYYCDYCDTYFDKRNRLPCDGYVTSETSAADTALQKETVTLLKDAVTEAMDAIRRVEDKVEVKQGKRGRGEPRP